MSEDINLNDSAEGEGKIHKLSPIRGLYQDWFLDYASYVILERAVPDISDGLKPVQRRILHAMRKIHDNRFHKVANVIGQTMQYHPHGDMAIGAALVNLGQKNLLIETQGNWGDVRTGDSAAAPRYIEAKLSALAMEIAFNDDTTEWQLSYDGRNKEPINLPVKFPLVLAQGVEGIAVGLSTKILPHNFIELCKASINVLKGKKNNLYPDFETGGKIDVSNYNGGKRGGKVRVRCNIEVADKKTLAIRDVPFGITTSSLIDSILKANEKGKIKIKKVTDNTAKNVEILIEVPSGVSPDITIDALYAFTNCEVSISPNACIIIDEKPHFLDVNDVVEQSTNNTVELLKRELEIRLEDLESKWHFSSLEKIFIENKIYRKIEDEETWEGVIAAIAKGLKPHVKDLKREVTEEDIVRLTEIKIKRISKFDGFKADEAIERLEKEMKQIKHDLKNLTDFAIAYFDNLIKKYGKGKERKTEIANFESIAVRKVAANNVKLYVNRKEGFLGYGLKKEEFVSECSDIDNVIVFFKDCTFKVVPIADKVFVGKGMVFLGIWRKGDDRQIYHLIYTDNKDKRNYVKRFAITSLTRDKVYDLTKGKKGGKIQYFTVNPNSESELVKVHLTQGSTARVKDFEYDFAELAIKGRAAGGNLLTKHPIHRIEQLSIGASTLGGEDVFFDPDVGKLNKESRGQLVGNFIKDDLILTIYKSGEYELQEIDFIRRYNADEVALMQKFDADTVVTAVHYNGKNKYYFVKRFQIETKTVASRFKFIEEHRESKLVNVSTATNTKLNFVEHKKSGKVDREELLTEFIDVKGWKAIGNRLSNLRLTHMKFEELPEPEKPIEVTKEAPTKDDKVEAGTTIDLKIEPTKNDPGKKGEQKELF